MPGNAGQDFAGAPQQDMPENASGFLHLAMSLHCWATSGPAG